MMQQLLDTIVYVPVHVAKQLHLDPIWTITATLILFFIQAGLVYLLVRFIDDAVIRYSHSY